MKIVTVVPMLQTPNLMQELGLNEGAEIKGVVTTQMGDPALVVVYEAGQYIVQRKFWTVVSMGTLPNEAKTYVGSYWSAGGIAKHVFTE